MNPVVVGKKEDEGGRGLVANGGSVKMDNTRFRLRPCLPTSMHFQSLEACLHAAFSVSYVPSNGIGFLDGDRITNVSHIFSITLQAYSEWLLLNLRNSTPLRPSHVVATVLRVSASLASATCN